MQQTPQAIRQVAREESYGAGGPIRPASCAIRAARTSDRAAALREQSAFRQPACARDGTACPRDRVPERWRRVPSPKSRWTERRESTARETVLPLETTGSRTSNVAHSVRVRAARSDATYLCLRPPGVPIPRNTAAELRRRLISQQRKGWNRFQSQAKSLVPDSPGTQTSLNCMSELLLAHISSQGKAPRDDNHLLTQRDFRPPWAHTPPEPAPPAAANKPITGPGGGTGDSAGLFAAPGHAAF